MVSNIKMLLTFFFLMFFVTPSTSIDSFGMNQSIRDGETLVSAGGSFVLGFFSPGTSTNRYLGVFYKDASGNQTVMWVANREKPLQNKSGILKFNENGTLQLFSGTTNTSVWSSNISTKDLNSNSSTAQLLDSGNLIVKSSDDGSKILWQSFDFPGDVLMPGMKIGLNLVTGLDRYLSTWKSADDPARGDYSIKFDPRGYPQIIQMKGVVLNAREGSWNGLYFTGYPYLVQNNMFRRDFFFNGEEMYYKSEILDGSSYRINRMMPSGIWQTTTWTGQGRGQVKTTTSGGLEDCDNFAFCGSNSVCNMVDNDAACECLKGYVPKFPEQWNVSHWSNGCVRKTASKCDITDGFSKYINMKLPDTSSSWFDKTMNLEECQRSCLKNCSCTAYANLDIRNGGTGCLLWFDHLIDMRQFNQMGQDLFIKVPSSELANEHGNMKKKNVAIVVAGVIIFGLIICAGIVLIKYPGLARNIWKNKQRQVDIDLPIFDFSVLAKATDNFSSNKKLGEGGFGPVYKGTLINGQELAVKRLSKKSGQGSEEFKNEVALIAKLQHRNLVKLLGCCIQGGEKILIYEFMPNKSLDHVVFDFGLARIFLGDQVEANTNKVAGTYGYISPEYAVHGQFSEKSDVFSYGVIVLELLSGKRNRDFSDSENYHNLLGHAWRLWTEEKPLELLDEVLRENCNPSEVIRCIQVGLLCVQQRPEDRPNMSLVVLMLNGEKMLPKPNFPGFYIDGGVQLQADSSSPNNTLFSANQISITILEAR
ncbi:G-type lectin S-receptor-like serine/threonine-protein kinase At4g27290 isoform X2 [Arachis stenosperma]|uniref:G-type lectin S-receptor-like serine/threonine-protein kinase At4g27290 isoform X2 n=1 Tax=Arachis stenosperma TaxID=217475 RepID=UPI0025ACB1CD|nr:G-type lectin S-receptor-like serine/threonine-protein kinase At4g27290 isoform X2 [Arachis stenosperma]